MTPRPPNPSSSPTFEHAAFPIGFGFVAGFVDLFGFMAWYGLLAAHVTGNLIFLAHQCTLLSGSCALRGAWLLLPVLRRDGPRRSPLDGPRETSRAAGAGRSERATG